MRDYAGICTKYAEDVVSGEVPACIHIVRVCKKYLKELKVKDDSFLYYFNENAAIRVCVFIEAQYHTKGKWAAERKKLVLEPWQIFFVCNSFGWLKKSDNLRRYTEILLMVPRKNGKSALAAAISLYMLCADGEYGAEIYIGATTEKQAGEVFIPAQQMVRKNPSMAGKFGIDCRASNINIPDTAGKLERLIGNPGDGSSPSLAVADEVHEHKDSRLVDTMLTGMGARSQPIMLYISTAGSNISGVCYLLQVECEKVLEGAVKDRNVFAMIYTVDSDDDWSTVEALKKANPNFGVSVSEEFLLARLADAKNNARKQSTYKTKHLNVWVGSMDAYFNIERWADSADSTLKIEDFHGRECYIGLDLASKVDIAALEVLIPTGDSSFVRFGKYYLPEAAIAGGENEHYQGWDSDGYLTITGGEIIDFTQIKNDILDLCSKFKVNELAYDPFQATMLVTELMSEGVPVVEVGATVRNFSEPMKWCDGLVRSRQISHNGDPVMAWMMSNVVARQDAKDNVFPRKERDENKIDGAVALIMALSRAMNDEGQRLEDFLNDPISVEF